MSEAPLYMCQAHVRDQLLHDVRFCCQERATSFCWSRAGLGIQPRVKPLRGLNLLKVDVTV